MLREVTTWQNLLDALKRLSAEDSPLLQQPIQCAPPQPNHDIPVELMPGIALGTVAALELPGARSTVDNKYHAEELVLLIDHNPFAEDGAIAYSWEDEDESPIYGKDGPTPVNEQMAPEKAELPKSTLLTVNARSKAYEVQNE